MSKEKQSEEKKPSAITRRDFLKGIAVGAVVTGAVATGVAAVSWPAAPPAPPGAVTKTETVTRTTTAAATTVTTTAPPVTTTATTTATTTLPAVTTTVTTTAPAPPAPVVPAYKKLVTLNVNGKDYTLEVENRTTLLDALSKGLGLTGTKWACNLGECGTCTVIMDKKPVLSCMILALEAEGKKILTVEGLAVGDKLHPIQEAFLVPEHFGFQCGYCTPGMLMSSKALLDRNPNPTELQVKEAIAGNLCRCGNYNFQVAAILDAARKIRGG